MKVLIAHNRYRSSLPSGENTVVEDEMRLLAAAGVTVVPLVVDSDQIDTLSPGAKAGVAAGSIINPVGRATFARMLQSERPDIVHLHNVVPLLSPWVVRTAHAAAVPVVQTVHNYRHTCMAGTHVLNGYPCEKCVVDRPPVAGVRYRCYRGSAIQSAAVAAGMTWHRETWRSVDQYVAPSEYVADRFRTRTGMAQVTVVPHSATTSGTGSAPGRDVVFLGRLTLDKGVTLLIDAWQKRPRAFDRLRIAGDGPLRERIRAVAASDPTIVFEGSVTGAAKDELFRAAAVVAIPSLLDESFGLVAIEAMAAGRPVLASTRGGLPEIVTPLTGWLAGPAAEGLGDCLRRAAAADLESMGRAARDRWAAEYTDEVKAERLVRLYEETLNRL